LEERIPLNQQSTQGKGQYLTAAPMATLAAEGIGADVQIIGVPFDSTSTYRTGSRFGPNAIREAFANVEVYSHRLDVDLETLSVADAGNVRHTASVDQMVRAAGVTVAECLADGYVPAVLGGEHSITYATFGAMPQGTALLLFDAHLDLRDEYSDLRLMHATFLRRLGEARPDLRVIHIGTRAATQEEWRVAQQRGYALLRADQVSDGGREAGEWLRGALDGLDNIYVSIDLDGLDPAYAPGVANPEAGGLSTRALLECLYALRGKNVVGFDIVELCPQSDPSGITAVAAARFLAELCGIIHLNKQSAR